MSSNFELMEALQVIEREKGVSIDTLLEALANALVSAYKRMPNAAEEAFVTIDPDTGEMHVYAQDLDEEGVVVAGRAIPYADIEKARTRFVWPEPSRPGRQPKGTPRPGAGTRQRKAGSRP